MFAEIGRRLLRRDAALVFLALWVGYGAAINLNDLHRNSLPPAVAEALVERGTFSVGGSRRFVAFDKALPHETRRLFNDFNRHSEDVLLPAKQPGHFVLGTLVYWPLTKLGLDLSRDYFVITALMGWLTAGLLGAAGGAALYLVIAGVWSFPRGVALFAVLLYAWATNLFTYSTTVHHDAIAAALLSLALYRIESVSAASRGASGFVYGCLLAATVSVSMAPIVVAGLLVLYGISQGRRFALGTLTGLILGLLPLLAYNLHYFGAVTDTAYSVWDTAQPHARLGPMLERLNTYVGAGYLAIWKYEPILGLGFFSALLIGQRLGRLRWLIPLIVACHVAFLTSLGSIGQCQFGPRYLIPVLPLLALGLPPLLDRARRSLVLTLAVFVVAAYSLVVNAVGAIGGSNYCYYSRYAVAEYLKSPGFGAGWGGLLFLSLVIGFLGWLLFWERSGWLVGADAGHRRLATVAAVVLALLIWPALRWLSRQSPAGRTWVTAWVRPAS